MSTTLRLPISGKSSTSSSNPISSSSSSSSAPITVSNPRAEYTRLALALLTVALTLGTAYSVLHNTYLDTSNNPLLSYSPHPAQESSYFARKKNVLNMWFVKKAWGWTVVLSAVLALSGRSSTGSQTPRTTSLWLWRIALATLVWASFTSWFFGPPLFDRVGAYTGAECVVVVPFPSPSDYSSFGIDGSAIDGLGEESATPGYDGLIGGRRDGVLVNVPIEYCHTRTTITPDSHAHLFTSPSSSSFTSSSSSSSSSFTSNLEEGWKEAIQSWKGGKARLYKGHDVSGHIFLLTLCILFLTDQVLGVLYPSSQIPTIKPSHIPTIKPSHLKVGTTNTRIRKVRGVEAWAFQATLALLALWWWMAIMTSVYFHTPQEKLSGFLIGIAGFLITRIPYPIPEPEPSKIGVPIPDEKLRSDAMKID